MSWYDCRNSPQNDNVQFYAALATPVSNGVSIAPNVRISAGASNSSQTHVTDDPNQFGDWTGLDFFNGYIWPAWSDNSNSTGDNPDPTTFDVYTTKLTVVTQSGPPVNSAGPSLAISLTRVPTRPTIGGTRGTVNFRISNNGPGAFRGTLDVRFAFSTDGTTGGTAGVVGDWTGILRLPSGRRGNFSYSFRYPADLPDNDYFLLAQADPEGRILESNYATTIDVSSHTIRVSHPLIDLAALNLTGLKAAARAGKTVLVTASLQNQGNTTAFGPVTVKVFISPDGSFDPAAAGEPLGTATQRLMIPAGQTRRVLARIILPAGSYHLVVQVFGLGDNNPANDVFVSALLLTVS
jgi:hypothetical protein